jgi:hypothetical protein
MVEYQLTQLPILPDTKLFRCSSCRRSFQAQRDISINGNCLMHFKPVDEELTLAQFSTLYRYKFGKILIYPLTVNATKS